MIRSSLLAAVALLGAPAAAGAQAYSCAVPAILPPVHPEGPDAKNPQRLLPIGGYTLAVIWAPEYCHGHADDPSARIECGGGNSFGWTLHGLWPDGVGPEWPQYCKAATLLPPATLRRNLCATPSAQLLQHEWAKHGTCTGLAPDAYFAKSTGMYARLRWPDMARLSHERQSTAGSLAQAIAAANPGIRAEAIRVTADRQGWLDQIWFCLDRQMAYTRCRANSGGVDPATPLKIATPRPSGTPIRYRSTRGGAGRDSEG